MSATATAPAPVATAAPPRPQASAPALPVPTPSVIEAMISVGPSISDLILSPGRPPQVEVSGKLVPVNIPQLPVLLPEHTARMVADLMGTNRHAMQQLKENGSADFSYSLPNCARFRVNAFQQRGSFAVVMRVIPNKIPTFEELNLPPQL